MIVNGMKLFTGIDGCRAGWLAVSLNEDFNWNPRSMAIFSVHELIYLCDASELVLADIPMGLKSTGPPERTCDREARMMLWKRRGSIFPVPVRMAVYADGYEKACLINSSIAGKKISKQSWNICGKIREMDEFLFQNPRCIKKLKETSPELCLMILNGNQALSFSKKTEDGRKERLRILEYYAIQAKAIYQYTLHIFKRRDVTGDDILDAMALAVSAVLIHKYGLTGIPEKPEYDERGIAMQIVIPNNICPGLSSP
ncbi:MAG: DUF429 domain-containing protein [Spirochaetota bacterium]